MGSFEELDTDEPISRRMERHAYDRLIMLSDGVFAIAATLLAFEIRPPAAWHGRLDDLITASIVGQVVSYVVSFMVVAIYWMGNRRILSMFRRVDGLATFFALVVLMLIALLPAISRTLVTDQGNLSQSSSVYVIYITLIGWAQGALWGYGAFATKLSDASLSTGFKIRTLIWMMVAPTVVSGAAMLSMGFAPGPWRYVGVGLAIVAMFILRERLVQPKTRT